MEIEISNFKVPVDQHVDLKKLCCQHYHLSENEIDDFKILRSSIDARKKSRIVYDYRFYLKINKDKNYLLHDENIKLYEKPAPMLYPHWPHPYPPVVVGFGPAGMFAALYLARCHANPIVIERGSCIENRKKEVEDFLHKKILNENSNIQFGEGGAGAFSDGKLTTNVHNSLIQFVLDEFYQHGATEDVTYMSNPHVGTDYLEKVVKNIREEIIAHGGKIFFNTLFTDFEQDKDAIKVYCSNNLKINTQHLLLGIGHSARDTMRHLFQKGIPMEAKPFSIGVRIEHLQKQINEMQYGKFAKYLPPATYKTSVHLKKRSVYSFCVCPGGEVMASTSEKNSIVTNGMSRKKRDAQNANGALLVNVTPDDFYKNSPLDGLDYQEKYEKMAFEIAKDYRAPANLMQEFLQGKIAQKTRSVTPSYPHGVIYCDFHRCLPSFIVDSLREALPLIDRKLKGFCHADAVLTGIETRSSSPVRILRNEKRESAIKGIYPIGEGAGYAGGITSAAIDGLKTAMQCVGNSLFKQ